MKYQIFVNQSKKFDLKFNVLKNVHLLYAHFQIFLVLNAANNSKFIELLIFFVNYK